MERQLTNRQLRLLGIRPVGDLLKIAISSQFLTDKGVILTDVPYGPLNQYDALFVDATYWSSRGKMTMVVLGNAEYEYDEGMDLSVGPLSDLYNSTLPFYVRYTDEFWGNRAYASSMTLDF